MKKKNRDRGDSIDNPKHIENCASIIKKPSCHSGGNHEAHTSTSDSGCCDEAEEEDDHVCRCGANPTGKRKHAGDKDKCIIL